MILLLLLTLLFWLTLNAKITIEILAFGIVVVGFLAFLMKKLAPRTFMNWISLKKIILLVDYFIMLTWEIIKANWGMLDIVINTPNEELEPSVTTFKTDLKSDWSRVTLANSITLTPGTITVAMDDNEYLIHALDASMLDGIDESIFVEKLRKLED